MRILFVIPYFYPAWTYGGPVRVAYDVSKELVERGHEVTVYTSDGNNGNSRITSRVKEVNGIQVHYFRNVSAITAKEMKLFITPEMIPLAKRVLQSFDVIHLHEYRSFQNVVIHYYARRSNIPYVLQAHGSLPKIMVKQRLKWAYDVFFGNRLLKDASRVIALSHMEVQQYKNRGVPCERIKVISNGIDLSEFNDLPEKGAFRKKHDIGEGEKLILYLGRIHEIKGVDLLIEAFASLLTDLSSAKLVVAGPDDGHLFICKVLVKKFHIENEVLFVGPLYARDKLEAYVDADVYVLPSRYETFPMSILEACACAKSVVATKVGAMADIIVNGRTGLLVQPNNVSELTGAIKHLLIDEEKAKKIGFRARERMANVFSIENIVNKLETLYEEIYTSSRAH